MRKIKRFNEALDNRSSISDSNFKESDGDIWISQSELLAAFNDLIKETINLGTHLNRDEKTLLTNGQLLDQVTLLLKEIKRAIGRIGGKINPVDPYGEEEWD
jgi:hypothetical protein